MRADLALVGFGNVGRRFARLLAERRDWLSLDYDLDCRVVGIATRRHGWAFDAERRRCGQPAARRSRAGQLARPTTATRRCVRRQPRRHPRGSRRRRADLKCWSKRRRSTSPPGQPAIDHVRAALQAGCDVVTANKGPVAFAYEELERARR